MSRLQMKRKPRLKNSHYITGIDGLRALAVIGVIIYHLLPYDLKGGYMGVPIFFVISGYLITDLFMKEWRQTGTINIKTFYYRRMKRLYPALVTTVIGSGAYITLFQRNLLVHLRSVIWTNLLYVYNWWEIAHGQSYFNRFQGESPFIHLWTLAIDGQYYLFWPWVMVALVLLLHKNSKLLAVLFIALTFIGAWYMAFIYMHTNNINRVYYGTDTRMFSFFAGIALAYMFPVDKVRHKLSAFKRILIDLIGLVSLIGLIYAGFTMAGQSASTYKGGMLLVTLEATVFLGTIVYSHADVNRVMTNPIFHWLGTRSYGIYLYQFPVMIFYEAKVPRTRLSHPLLNAIIEMIIIGLISEASFRWIEQPMHHYDYSRLGYDIKHYFRNRSFKSTMRKLLIIPVIAVFYVCGVGAVQAPNHQNPNMLQKHITTNQRSLSKGNKQLIKRQKKDHGKDKVTNNQLRRPLTKQEQQVAKRYGLNKRQVLDAKSFPMTAVGDSVLVDGSKDLHQVFKNTLIKAKVGGQLNQAADILRQEKSNHTLQKNILVNIGTNAPLTSSQIKEIMDIVGPHRNVYWITAHVPTKPYQNSTNNTIRRAGKKYRNFHVIDWYAASHSHSNYFWSDHVHPNPKGNQEYTSLIVKTIFK
ncbi:acetyltransferase [uncultured bacterium]|uniref:Acetyltransferase n=2 Tax=Acetilactobacillus jinshanensis TaxID=1720083 RepID=A0A4P6ZJU3_9LACO|nr:acetyltransferase [Acetilactobacillus jinshanensis]URL61774.1 acetyltransferase [uncultured bacterium]